MEKEYTEKQMDSAYDTGFKHGQNRKAAMINPPNLDDVMDKQKDFLTWYTTGNNKHYVGDKLIEAYKKEVLNQ